jgi:hypothetical protein
MENDCATAAATGAILCRGVAWTRRGAVILSSHDCPATHRGSLRAKERGAAERFHGPRLAPPSPVNMRATSVYRRSESCLAVGRSIILVPAAPLYMGCP